MTQVSIRWVLAVVATLLAEITLIARWIRRRARSAAFGTAMAMAGLYLAIEIAVLLAWPGDTSGTLPFMIGGMVLKVAGAWLGASGIAARASANTAV